jgi:hypothetical protein
MVWSAPMTAVAGSAFTAAQFNQYVRDNLLETGPAKVTAAGQILVATAANSLASRTIGRDVAFAAVTTTSTAYTSLSGGPSVTVTMGAQCIVILTAQILNTTAGLGGRMAYNTSGASSVTEDDDHSFGFESGNASDINQGSYMAYHGGFTAGSNTFAARYRATGGGTADFNRRQLNVIPL